MAFGIYTYTSGNNPGTPQASSPADTLQGVNNAVQQTQDLQDKINSKAKSQLDQ